MHACKQQSMVRGCQQDKKEGRRSKEEDKKQERETHTLFCGPTILGFCSLLEWEEDLTGDLGPSSLLLRLPLCL